MNSDTYLIQFGLLIVGCVVLGVRVYIEMLANIVMLLSGEDFFKVASITFDKDFGKTKVTFDLVNDIYWRNSWNNQIPQI